VTGSEDIVELPIDGRLDLHLFHPRDVKRLVGAYLDACQENGVLDVEIVHGKGTGALLRTVRALLERRPDVANFRLAEEARGGWGVTLVRLVPTRRGGRSEG
jgi:DNA-nicking Smr family endonuclease